MKSILYLLSILILFGCSKREETSAAAPDPSEPTQYSFFVAGHAYGSPVDNSYDPGMYPPFVRQLPWLCAQPNLAFGVLTGDVVRRPEPSAWDSIFHQLDALHIPIHIAPGNHDVGNRKLYTERVGKGFYAFTHDRDRFVILDLNLDRWNISGAQRDFVEQELDNAHQYRYVFLFGHQYLWWKDEGYWSACQPNSFAHQADTLTFHHWLRPRLEALENERVVVFVGDAGAVQQSQALCYLRHSEVDYIASGMGVRQQDNFLLVEVHADSVHIRPIGLRCRDDRDCLGSLEDYLQ